MTTMIAWATASPRSTAASSQADQAIPKARRGPRASFGTEVRDTLDMPVVLTDSDRPRKVTTSEAALMRLREKALKGDGRSLDRLLELMRQYCDENATASEQMDEEDAEILADYEARILQKHGYGGAEIARNPISSKRKRK